MLSREEEIMVERQCQTASKSWSMSTKLHRFAEAQNWRCCYCGCRMHHKDSEEYGQLDPKRLATREHVIPVGIGGWNANVNIVVACHECNTMRGHVMTADHWCMLLMWNELTFLTLTQIQWLYSRKDEEQRERGYRALDQHLVAWTRYLYLRRRQVTDRMFLEES